MNCWHPDKSCKYKNETTCKNQQKHNNYCMFDYEKIMKNKDKTIINMNDAIDRAKTLFWMKMYE